MKMLTGLLLLIFTSCAMTELYHLNAKVGDTVRLNLGNGTVWCRDKGNGDVKCQFFFLSTARTTFQNGSLIITSVRESDSGKYFSPDTAKKVPNRKGNGGLGKRRGNGTLKTLLARREIVLNVTP
ncbi:hypothetical protein GCK32_007640 [Trichostrongylus colubriformis]|uniref:Uncharacterized protein n=1 Tax=Trichostrongylus colubriformis TaxID=6319 RepID=A0AAN8FSY7_TRICO